MINCRMKSELKSQAECWYLFRLKISPSNGTSGWGFGELTRKHV